MATPQEARVYNQNEIYWMAGYNILTGVPYTSAATLDGTVWLVYADTTSAPFTLTLPATPSEGQSYVFLDKAGTFAANNLTISGNGNNINAAATLVLSTNYSVSHLRFNGTIWNIFHKAP